MVAVLLSGCAVLPDFARSSEPGSDAGDGSVRPQARPPASPPPATARTEAEFDTTTPEEQAAAQTMPTAGSERALGTTVASLGAPSEPGFWLKTPLVEAQEEGRVYYPPSGKSVRVTLLPIEGPATAGSRMSLPTLRLLGVPITALAEIEVFAGG
jgi:hypothetical protein